MYKTSKEKSNMKYNNKRTANFEKVQTLGSKLPLVCF